MVHNSKNQNNSFVPISVISTLKMQIWKINTVSWAYLRSNATLTRILPNPRDFRTISIKDWEFNHVQLIGEVGDTVIGTIMAKHIWLVHFEAWQSPKWQPIAQLWCIWFFGYFSNEPRGAKWNNQKLPPTVGCILGFLGRTWCSHDALSGKWYRVMLFHRPGHSCLGSLCPRSIAERFSSLSQPTSRQTHISKYAYGPIFDLAR